MNEFFAGLGNLANGVIPAVAQKALEDNGLVNKTNPVTVNPGQSPGARSWEKYLLPGAGLLAVVLVVLILRRK